MPEDCVISAADLFPPAQLYIVVAITATIISKLEEASDFAKLVTIGAFSLCGLHLLGELVCAVAESAQSDSMDWSIFFHAISYVAVFAAFLAWNHKKPKGVLGEKKKCCPEQEEKTE